MTIAEEFLFKARLIWWVWTLAEYRGHAVCVEGEPRPFLLDPAGRRWMLDGSGDVA